MIKDLEEKNGIEKNAKGLPAKQWFYYLNKNFGFVTGIVYSIIPYLKIVLGI